MKTMSNVDIYTISDELNNLLNNNKTKISIMEEKFTYSGFENRETCEHLRKGETCKVTGIGNSMTPILLSHQPVICEPVTDETEVYQ